MALSSFSQWEEPLRGGGPWDGVFLLFFSYGAGETRNNPVALGSTCTSLREGGCLCIDTGWGIRETSRNIPRKHPLGDNGNTHGSTAPGRRGKALGCGAPGSSLGGHRAVRSPWNVLDGSMSGWHPSVCTRVLIPHPDTERIPGKHDLGNLFRQPRLTAGPAAAVSRELLPASGMLYCWITQSPHLIADTTEAFSHLL